MIPSCLALSWFASIDRWNYLFASFLVVAMLLLLILLLAFRSLAQP